MLAPLISRLTMVCTSCHTANAIISLGAPSWGWLGLAVLTALVSLTACSPPTPAQQVTLRIGILRIQDDLPYFVMQEQGFAKQHGVQFVETVYRSGSAIIEAMTAGAVDVCSDVGTVPIFDAAERGLVPSAVVPVGSTYFSDPEHPLSAVLVASSVNSWKELEGQQVAVNGKKTLSAAAIKGRLKLEGVQNATLVEISFADMGLAVAGGNVAAAVMWEPWLTQSLLRGDGKLLGWVIGGPPFERIKVTMLLIRGDLYRNNPQAVKAFLRAKLEAIAWINQHPDKARSVLARRLDLAQEVAQRVRLPRWSLHARHDPALLESIQPLLMEIGLLKAPIPISQLSDKTLLAEVLAEKR